MRWILFSLACLTAGCGDVEFPTRPTREVPSFYTQAPAPPIVGDRSDPPPAPSLPATVPAISGQWSGLFLIIDSGLATRSEATVTVSQADRAVVALWRSVPSGALQGEIRGTLTGLGSDTRFVGQMTFSAPSSIPGARCQVTGAIDGQAFPSRLWLDAPDLTLSGCTGDIRDVRLTFFR